RAAPGGTGEGRAAALPSSPACKDGGESVSDSSAAPAATLRRALVEEMSGAAGEPAWLRDRRLAAWEAFVRLPLPSANDEEWRRTDISKLDLDAFGVLPHIVQKGRAAAPLAALAGDADGAGQD